jgi:hypothetical protein
LDEAVDLSYDRLLMNEHHFLKIHLNIILPCMSRSIKWPLSCKYSTKLLYTFLRSTMHYAPCLAHPIFPFITLIIPAYRTNYEVPHYGVLSAHPLSSSAPYLEHYQYLFIPYKHNMCNYSFVFRLHARKNIFLMEFICMSIMYVFLC